MKQEFVEFKVRVIKTERMVRSEKKLLKYSKAISLDFKDDLWADFDFDFDKELKKKRRLKEKEVEKK